MLKQKLLKFGAIFLVLVLSNVFCVTSVIGASVVNLGEKFTITNDGSVNALPTIATAFASVKVGDYLYVAAKAGGVEIFNVSALNAPVRVVPADTTNLIGTTMDSKGCIYSDGTNLYVAFNTPNVIRRYSLANPENPVLTATFASAKANDVFAKDGYVYSANSGGRIYLHVESAVVDAQTTLAYKNVIFQSAVPSIAYNGNTFFAALNDGIYAFNMTNPIALTAQSTWETLTNAPGSLYVAHKLVDGAKFSQIKVSNGYLYCSDTNNKKVYRIDVTTPTNLANADKWTLVYTPNGTASLNSFDVLDDSLYVHQGTTAYRVDLAQATYPIQNTMVTGNSNTIKTYGKSVFIANKIGVDIIPADYFNITLNKLDNAKVSTEITNSYTDAKTTNRMGSVAGYGNYLYLSGRDAGIQILNITNPDSPVGVTIPAGNTELIEKTATQRGSITIKGNYLYCAYQPNTADKTIKIKKFDISTTPELPQLVTTFVANFGTVSPPEILRIIVTDSYVIAGTARYVYKWNNTGSASIVNKEDTHFNAGNAYHIVSNGDFIYALTREGIVRMFDAKATGVATTTTPYMVEPLVSADNIKDTNTNYSEQALALDNGSLYVVNGTKMCVYNVTNNNKDFFKNKDYVENQYSVLANTEECLAKDGFLYVLSGTQNLAVFDVTIPKSSILVENKNAVLAMGATLYQDRLYATVKGSPTTGTKLNTLKISTSKAVSTSTIINQLPLEFTGSSIGSSTVSWQVDNGTPQNVTVGANNAYSFSLSSLALGYHTIKVSIPSGATTLSEEKTVYMPAILAKNLTFSGDTLVRNTVLNASCLFTNSTGAIANPVLIVALYNGDEMVEIQLVNGDIPANAVNLSENVSITIPDVDITNYRATVFVWDDFSGITPLATQKEIN